MTAISAAREGKKVLLLERTAYIGGLPANGLGATDLATRGATTGLFRRNRQTLWGSCADANPKLLPNDT